MIPEDIMKTAREVCQSEQFRLMVFFAGASLDEGTIEAVARALLAERERCAQIADDEAMHGCGCNPVALGERIAERIRNA